MNLTTVANHDHDEARLISRILNMYYVQERTQAEIGCQLGLSTARVNRLLKQARHEGMVEIKIHTPFQYLFDLEARLKATFGIPEVLVIPAVAGDETALVQTLGRAGASHLLGRLRDGDIVAIGGGTGVYAVVEALQRSRAYDVQVVPALGGIQGRVTTDVNYLATRMAERLGGRAYQLHAPAFVDTRQHRDLLLAMSPIKEILDIARQATVALVGVGSVSAERSRFVEFTALSPADMHRIAAECGGIGEILGHVYDASGRFCAPGITDRVVGITPQELARIPDVVGVAATAAKAVPIYGVLRGGYLSALITDEAAAEGVLDIVDHGFWQSSSG